MGEEYTLKCIYENFESNTNTLRFKKVLSVINYDINMILYI
jgi:hypothetical protein